MNILVVCQYYYPEPFRISDICEALAARGHSVTVVTGTPNYPEGKIYPGYENGAKSDEVIRGVRVHRCPIVPRKTGAAYRFLNYYSFPLASRKYLRSLKEDFDVVFVNQLSPVMMAEAGIDWAKRHGKRCVLYCLDLWPESLLVGGIRPDSAIYRFFLKISKSIYRRVDALAVSSHGFLPYFRDALGMDDSKIRYIPQYAENLFDDIDAAQTEKETVDFLFAGNIGNLQSVETIVEAARILKDDEKIRFHIVGGGISLERCRTLAQGLDNITFYGRQDLSKMPEYYSMADVMMISMVRDPGMSMNFPGKVQSYMAAGKPVAASLDGETARILADADCGLSSPAEDPEGFVQVVRKLAADPELRARFGRNARKYYDDNFRKEVFVDRLAELLQENCR